MLVSCENKIAVRTGPQATVASLNMSVTIITGLIVSAHSVQMKCFPLNVELQRNQTEKSKEPRAHLGDLKKTVENPSFESIGRSTEY